MEKTRFAIISGLFQFSHGIRASLIYRRGCLSFIYTIA